MNLKFFEAGIAAFREMHLFQKFTNTAITIAPVEYTVST